MPMWFVFGVQSSATFTSAGWAGTVIGSPLATVLDDESLPPHAATATTTATISAAKARRWRAEAGKLVI